MLKWLLQLCPGSPKLQTLNSDPTTQPLCSYAEPSRTPRIIIGLTEAVEARWKEGIAGNQRLQSHSMQKSTLDQAEDPPIYFEVSLNPKPYIPEPRDLGSLWDYAQPKYSKPTGPTLNRELKTHGFWVGSRRARGHGRGGKLS